MWTPSMFLFIHHTTIFTHFPSQTQTLSTIQVMGNYRFRFSDMIPNAWFHKLRDMNKIRNLKTNTSSSSLSSFSSSSSLTAKDRTPSQKPHLSEQRKSYYFTRDPPIKARASGKPPPVEPPRKSSRRRRSTKRSRRPPIISSSISARCSCRATLWTKPSSPSSSEHDSILTEYGSDRLSWSSSCKCRTENDIVFDMVNDGDANPPFNQPDHLPPIITKKPEPTKIERTSAEFSEKNKFGSLSVKVVKENFVSTASPLKRFSVTSSSPGVKLRTNSPRIAHRRVQGRRSVSSNSSSGTSRRSVTESFAVVKSSKDPGRDFRESMMEMIVENNIRASKDLEELLACYLSLNSDEYHDLIINVFKQIWFDFIHLRLK